MYEIQILITKYAIFLLDDRGVGFVVIEKKNSNAFFKRICTIKNILLISASLFLLAGACAFDLTQWTLVNLQESGEGYLILANV